MSLKAKDCLGVSQLVSDRAWRAGNRKTGCGTLHERVGPRESGQPDAHG